MRTQANARNSDATVWFGDPTSPGGIATLRACTTLGRPVFMVEDRATRQSDLATWVVRNLIGVQNVTRATGTRPRRASGRGPSGS